MKKEENVQNYHEKSTSIRINGIRYLAPSLAGEIIGLSGSGLKRRFIKTPQNPKKQIPYVLVNDRFFVQESTIYLARAKIRGQKTIQYFKLIPTMEQTPAMEQTPVTTTESLDEAVTQKLESIAYDFFVLDDETEDLVRKWKFCKIESCQEPIETLEKYYYPDYQESVISDCHYILQFLPP